VRENERNGIKRRSKPKIILIGKYRRNNNMEFVKGEVICILH
jgi:hypothetical protein